MKSVVIVGGGFAGLNAAKVLGQSKDVQVTLLDERNNHLFQPLLYQVAMAALSPADIAVPIRSILSEYKNIWVSQERVEGIDREKRLVHTNIGSHSFDYLVLACGARHSYFGNNGWEEYAPGLKTIEQATEIRRRVLSAYEAAEQTKDSELQRELLTFVVIGGGPTGVELAGAIGEMSRFTLARDFRNIDPKATRIILIEAGPRILTSFSTELASHAMRDLEKIGVQVWTNSRVVDINSEGVSVGSENIRTRTVLWAAGIQAAEIGEALGVALDRSGRVYVEPDLSIADSPEIFVVGDQAYTVGAKGTPLPSIAPVAMQQGRYVAHTILAEIRGEARKPFLYNDKGQVATIGRCRAVMNTGRLQFSGIMAWIAWVGIHIYYLTGFKNRVFVTFNWAWSHLKFRRGARLIVEKEWRFYGGKDGDTSPPK